MSIPTPQIDRVKFVGGANFVTTPIDCPPGMPVDASNFECDVDGGYARIGGFEAFDGKPLPSSYLVYYLPRTQIVAAGDGQTIVGQTSGAQAFVIRENADNYVIGYLRGNFVAGETVKVGVTDVGTLTDHELQGGGELLTELQVAQDRATSANAARLGIGAVPGAGPVRGVFMIGSTKYAFRNTVGNTACALWRATTTGWVRVDFDEEVYFTNAAAGIEDGDTLTQGGVTALVKRVVIQTGSLTSGVNTGKMIIRNRAGGNFAAGAATLPSAVTLGGVQSAITLSPGGKFDIERYNFGGNVSMFRVYWTDGVNRCHEFDGDAAVPIDTGMPGDAPELVCAHAGTLFLSFGSSLQTSGEPLQDDPTIGPYRWTATVGAGEIGIGDEIVGLLSMRGDDVSGALIVATKTRIGMLYGNTAATFQMRTFIDDYGAQPWSMQQVTQPLFMDDYGISSVASSQSYGRFQDRSISHLIRPFVESRRGTTSCSMVCRDKTQYRIYFVDGGGVHCSFAGSKLAGMMPVQLPIVPFCAFSGINATGQEEMYIGGGDGFLYRMDSGTSFNGANIEARLTLPFSSKGNARVLKSFKKVATEMKSSSYARICIGYELGYGVSRYLQPSVVPLAYAPMVPVQWDNFFWDNFTWDGLTADLTWVPGVECLEKERDLSYWDGFTWDRFTWDGNNYAPLELSVSGTAENISIKYYSNDSILEPFTLTGVMTHFIPRRNMR